MRAAQSGILSALTPCLQHGAPLERVAKHRVLEQLSMSHEAPTVPFAAVASAQELELLAEVSAASGNASDIARRILRRLPAEAGRRSYAYENGFSFHFLTEGRLIFLCMERGVPPPKAFAFLAEMQQSWRTQFAGEPEPEPASPGPEHRAPQRVRQARAARAASRTSSSSSETCAPRPSAAPRATTTSGRCSARLDA